MGEDNRGSLGEYGPDAKMASKAKEALEAMQDPRKRMGLEGSMFASSLVTHNIESKFSNAEIGIITFAANSNFISLDPILRAKCEGLVEKCIDSYRKDTFDHYETISTPEDKQQFWKTFIDALKDELLEMAAELEGGDALSKLVADIIEKKGFPYPQET